MRAIVKRDARLNSRSFFRPSKRLAHSAGRGRRKEKEKTRGRDFSPKHGNLHKCEFELAHESHERSRESIRRGNDFYYETDLSCIIGSSASPSGTRRNLLSPRASSSPGLSISRRSWCDGGHRDASVILLRREIGESADWQPSAISTIRNSIGDASGGRARDKAKQSYAKQALSPRSWTMLSVGG